MLNYVASAGPARYPTSFYVTIYAPFCRRHRSHWSFRIRFQIWGFLGTLLVTLFLLTTWPVVFPNTEWPALALVAPFLPYAVGFIYLRATKIRVVGITEDGIVVRGVHPTFAEALTKSDRSSGSEQ
jgi:hypothetical protein